MKTQVLYKSRTGNTEKIAKAIFEAIPGNDKDIAAFQGQTDYNMGDLYFIGFWTDREAPVWMFWIILAAFREKELLSLEHAGWDRARSTIKK